MNDVKYICATITDVLSNPFINQIHKNFDSQADAIAAIPKEKPSSNSQYIVIRKEMDKQTGVTKAAVIVYVHNH